MQGRGHTEFNNPEKRKKTRKKDIKEEILDVGS